MVVAGLVKTQTNKETQIIKQRISAPLALLMARRTRLRGPFTPDLRHSSFTRGERSLVPAGRWGRSICSAEPVNKSWTEGAPLARLEPLNIQTVTQQWAGTLKKPFWVNGRGTFPQACVFHRQPGPVLKCVDSRLGDWDEPSASRSPHVLVTVRVGPLSWRGSSCAAASWWTAGGFYRSRCASSSAAPPPGDRAAPPAGQHRKGTETARQQTPG